MQSLNSARPDRLRVIAHCFRAEASPALQLCPVRCWRACPLLTYPSGFHRIVSIQCFIAALNSPPNSGLSFSDIVAPLASLSGNQITISGMDELVCLAPVPRHHERDRPDAALCRLGGRDGAADHFTYNPVREYPALAASHSATSPPPTLHRASHRPYRSFRVVSQLTGLAPIRSVRARAACWPQRHSEPSCRVHGWRLSGASMSKIRTRAP